MLLENSILEDIREAVGLSRTATDFDIELKMHINAAIGKLNQNGVGRDLVVTDETATWGDLQDPAQSDDNGSFNMVPLFVMLSTKLVFDPPPPSSVPVHQTNIEELLWRLKIAYETPLTTTTTTSNEDW